MKREDFIFSIGYTGETAIVDKGARAKYGSNSTEQLLDEGLYRAAFCSALFGGEENEMEGVRERVNRDCGTSIETITQLKRLYGVFAVPSNVTRIKAL